MLQLFLIKFIKWPIQDIIPSTCTTTNLPYIESTFPENKHRFTFSKTLLFLDEAVLDYPLSRSLSFSFSLQKRDI